MPLEVNELGIYMRVSDGGETKAAGGKPEDDCECKDFNKDEVVQECVAKVLEILERKNRR